MKKTLLLTAAAISLFALAAIAEEEAKTPFCDITNYKDYIRDKEKVENLIDQTGQGCNLAGETPWLAYKAHLMKANLKGTNFSDRSLIDADLTGAYAQEANFSGTYLNEATFVKIQAERAKFSSVHTMFTNFNEANLFGADFDLSYLRSVSFRLADLTSANMIQSIFWEGDLWGATLSETNFTYAHFTHTDFRCSTPIDANFTEAWLNGTLLNRANFHGANFNKARIQGVDFSGLNLRDTKNLHLVEFISDSTYNSSTQFPENFDVSQFPGLKLKHDSDFSAEELICPNEVEE